MDGSKPPYDLDAIVDRLKQQFGDELPGKYIASVALATALLIEPEIRRDAYRSMVEHLEGSRLPVLQEAGTALRLGFEGIDKESDHGSTAATGPGGQD